MQVTRLALLAAVGGVGGAVASSAGYGLAHEIRGLDLDLGVGGAGLLVAPRQQATPTKNLQTFTGALGGIKADAVIQTTDQTRPFTVDGSTFTDFASAAGRSCDNQKNSCAQMANNGKPGFTVSDCDNQNVKCKANITNPSAAQQQPSQPAVSSGTTTTAAAAVTSLSLTSTSTPPPVNSVVASTTTSATLALVSQNAEFNFFCEV